LPIKCDTVIYEGASVSLNNLRISKGSRKCEKKIDYLFLLSAVAVIGPNV